MSALAMITAQLLIGYRRPLCRDEIQRVVIDAVGVSSGGLKERDIGVDIARCPGQTRVEGILVSQPGLVPLV